MTEPTERLTHYARLHPTKFPVLLSLWLSQDDVYGTKTPSLSLLLELGSIEDSTGQRLRLSFQGVQQCHLKQPSLSLFQMTLIDIYPIGEWQWEHLNYKVIDSEDETLSFYCADFQATLLDGF